MAENPGDRALFPKLDRLGIRHFDQLIHDQPKDWLLENFRSGSTKFPVNVTALIRNLIWQTRERIAAGDREPMRELIRTFWYSHIKPTLARADALSEESDQYDELVQQLVTLVRDERLMNYADIGFRDDNEAVRHAGDANPNVVVFAEKEGQAAFLKEIANRYGVSTLALGGQPSALTSEYFVRDLKEKGVDLRRSFYLYGITDYDTSGAIIRDAFVKNLHAFDIKNIKTLDLVHPDMFTPDEIRFSRFPIPDDKGNAKKNTDWLREIHKRGYINQKELEEDDAGNKRKIYGIESEALSAKRLADKLAEVLPPVLGKDERFLTINQLDRLTKSIEDLILQKIRGR